MKNLMTWLGTAAFLVIVASAAWIAIGLSGHSDFLSAHLLDILMGFVCLFWLMLILKAPWDLYFKAQEVAFEQQRAREHNIVLTQGREAYIVSLRRKLLWFALAAHLFSAAVIAAVTWFSHGRVGYYFAGFYLISTVFRPTFAAYRYFANKLSAISQESFYPREDVNSLRAQVIHLENTLNDQSSQLRDLRSEVARRDDALRTELAVLRQDNEALRYDNEQLLRRLNSLNQEFERTVTRLSDNQELLGGIQAFVRLVAQTARSGPATD